MAPKGSLENTKSRSRHGGRRKRVGPAAILVPILEIVLLVVIGIAVAGAVRTFVCQSFYIPSSSMEETLKEGDTVLALKFNAQNDLRRGDVIIFHDPSNWLEGKKIYHNPPSDNFFVKSFWQIGQFVGFIPEQKEDYITKRVIGLPGDRVTVNKDRKIVINGTPLDEYYLASNTIPSKIGFDVTVPKDRLFVLGDNRSNSSDSRYNSSDKYGGFVPISNVIGKINAVIFPFDHFQWLPDVSSVFSKVQDPARKE